MTSNFDDLKYWESKDDLDGKKVKDVVLRINQILTKLTNEGFVKRELDKEDEESMGVPSWMWGHKKRNENKYSENLPDSIRTSILMYHLNDLLNVLKEYNNEYYCFSDK